MKSILALTVLPMYHRVAQTTMPFQKVLIINWAISDYEIAEDNQSSFSNDKQTFSKQWPSMNACSNELIFQRRGINIRNFNSRHLKPKLDKVNLCN